MRRGHGREVVLERIGIDQQRRCRQFCDASCDGTEIGEDETVEAELVGPGRGHSSTGPKLHPLISNGRSAAASRRGLDELAGAIGCSSAR